MDVAASFSPDIRTLVFLLAVVLVLATAVYTSLWLQGAAGRAAGFWALAHGVGTAGYALLALRGAVPDIVSITLANIAILAGGLLIVKGIHTHLGRRYPDHWVVAALVAFALVFAYFTHIQPNIASRIFLIAAGGAVITLWGGIALVAQPSGARGWVHIYTAMALWLVAAVNVVRMLELGGGPVTGTLMAASALHAYSFAVILLAVVAWTLGFFWMIAQGLRQDLAEEVAVRRAQEQSLRESEQRFRAIFDSAATGILFSNPQGQILQVNEAFARLVQRDPERLTGRTFMEITHPDDRAASGDALQRLIDTGEDYCRFEKRYATPGGESVWVDLAISAIRNEAGEALYFVAVANDIQERKARQAELEQQATYDPLTGTVNRRRFQALLDHELKRMARYGEPASLIMFDLDHFKAINDQYGHEVGDDVLTGLTAGLSQYLRAPDVMGRWGGEEFMILAPQTRLGGAASLAEKLRQVAAATTFDPAGTVTISLGATQLQAGEDAHEAVQRVDQALYKAKNQGRNAVVSAAPPESEPGSESA